MWWAISPFRSEPWDDALSTGRSQPRTSEESLQEPYRHMEAEHLHRIMVISQ